MELTKCLLVCSCHSETFSHDYCVHKGHAIYLDTSITKIRDKIVLQEAQVYEKSPRLYCFGDQN